MKLLILTTLTLLAVSIAGSCAVAKTATAAIGESAQIVPGNSVSAYLVRGELVTDVRDDAASAVNPYGVRPLLRVSFDVQHPWFLVKRITWDKVHRKLTIDF
jgi:hypothetical protein